MKSFFLLAIIIGLQTTFSFGFSQSNLTIKGEDGIYKLSYSGAAYFAKLSLQCAEKSSPHFYEKYKEHLEEMKEEIKEDPKSFRMTAWQLH